MHRFYLEGVRESQSEIQSNSLNVVPIITHNFLPVFPNYLQKNALEYAVNFPFSKNAFGRKKCF